MDADARLAERISQALQRKQGITRKKMFGGLCFLLKGNMLCGIAKGKLVARVGPEAYDAALRLKHTAPMDFTGRPLKGMVYVLPDGTRTQAAVNRWVDKSLAFVGTLPAKKK